MNLLILLALVVHFTSFITGQELLDAIRRYDSPAVSAYLKMPRIDVNERYKHGITALHYAASKGLLDITKQLIHAGASPYARTNQGETPLLIAALYNQPSIVEYLFKKASDSINIHNHACITPLHGLVTHGHTDLIKKVMPHITHPCIQESHGVTPFMIAVFKQNTELVHFLLPHCTRHLEKADFDGNTALFATILNRNLWLADLLISHGANQNHASRNGTTPLLLATQKNDVTFCQFLISRYANPEATNSHGENALMIAIKNGNVPLVRLFTSVIHNINHQDRTGATALEHAVRHNNIEAVNLLLSHESIVPNIRNRFGKTPYDIALEHNLTAIAQKLVCFSDRPIESIYELFGIDSSMSAANQHYDQFESGIATGGVDLDAPLFTQDQLSYFFLDGLE